jgi:hypothetical protein
MFPSEPIVVLLLRVEYFCPAPWKFENRTNELLYASHPLVDQFEHGTGEI